MRRVRWYAISFVLLVALGCASAPPRPVRSEFDDIPVPKGLTLDTDRTTIIESPSVKAARLLYKGRIEPESLALAIRNTLESNGWRHVTSTAFSKHGITQVYEKGGNTLQVQVYEGWWYTWVELTTTRILVRQ